MVEQRRIPMAEADPYLLLGLLGKKVIHPGGRQATEELFALAALAVGQQVLDVGCGAGTTAIEMATRFGVTVTAVDISPVAELVRVCRPGGLVLATEFHWRRPPRLATPSWARFVRECFSTPSTIGSTDMGPLASLISR